MVLTLGSVFLHYHFDLLYYRDLLLYYSFYIHSIHISEHYLSFFLIFIIMLTISKNSFFVVDDSSSEIAYIPRIINVWFMLILTRNMFSSIISKSIILRRCFLYIIIEILLVLWWDSTKYVYIIAYDFCTTSFFFVLIKFNFVFIQYPCWYYLSLGWLSPSFLRFSEHFMCQYLWFFSVSCVVYRVIHPELRGIC